MHALVATFEEHLLSLLHLGNEKSGKCVTSIHKHCLWDGDQNLIWN